jgi:hypothetical protein
VRHVRYVRLPNSTEFYGKTYKTSKACETFKAWPE